MTLPRACLHNALTEGEWAIIQMGHRGLRLAGWCVAAAALTFAFVGCSKKSKEIAATTAPAEADASLSAGFRSHTVGPRETLYRLATIYYGDGRLWQKIYYANKNRIADPSDLPVGIRLIIPPRDDPSGPP